MIVITDRQLTEMAKAREAGFRVDLARAAIDEYPNIITGTEQDVLNIISPMLDRARALGFTSPREAGAFVLASLPVGESRLQETESYLQAAFNAGADASTRATLLIRARDQALAGKDVDDAWCF
jgi:hypothetical protein